jgi:hypothetical protein
MKTHRSVGRITCCGARSLEGSEDLQPPDMIAAEIAETLPAALKQSARSTRI